MIRDSWGDREPRVEKLPGTGNRERLRFESRGSRFEELGAGVRDPVKVFKIEDLIFKIGDWFRLYQDPGSRIKDPHCQTSSI